MISRPPVAIEMPSVMDCEWAHEERGILLAHAELGDTAELELRFGQVEFVDSAGIGLIVALHRKLKGLNKNLRITDICGQPLALVRQLGLDQVVEVQAQETA